MGERRNAYLKVTLDGNDINIDTGGNKEDVAYIAGVAFADAAEKANPENVWVEARYSSEKWSDGTSMVRGGMHGDTNDVATLICSLAMLLIEQHAGKQVDKQAAIDNVVKEMIAAIRKNAKTISAKFATEGKDKTKRMVS